MEGIGSRLGRASSRYGSTAVFNGPVRKWKKKWVQVSSSNVTYQNSQVQSNGQSNSSRLLLCKWIPSSSAVDGENNSGVPEEPPRRKFRYTPIAALGKQKKEVAERAQDEAKISKTDQSSEMLISKSDDIHGKPNVVDILKKETQASNKNVNSKRSHLDLGLCLTGHNENQDSIGENREGRPERKTSDGFWKMG